MSCFHGPDLGPFQWDDPLLLEGQLTEDERMIRDTARDFAAKELAPRVQKAYLEEKTDPKLFRLMGESGLLGVTLPEEFGCAGAGYVSYGLVAREVERVDSGFRSMMSVQSSLVMYPIHAYGDSDQHRKYLPGLAQRRTHRLLRAHRAGRGLRSRRHDDAGREDRRRLPADGLENVDQQCADRRRLRGVGEVARARRSRSAASSSKRA